MNRDRELLITLAAFTWCALTSYIAYCWRHKKTTVGTPWVQRSERPAFYWAAMGFYVFLDVLLAGALVFWVLVEPVLRRW
jgi:hypothetical protein